MASIARDSAWMRRALELAQCAGEAGEVPVGAVLVRGEEVLGEGWNRPISESDPTAHAEIVALRAAARAIGNYRLLDTTLYVTLEPCAMCAGALVHARVGRLVFAAADPKAGAVISLLRLLDTPGFNHYPRYEGGLMAAQSADLLTAFFRARR